MKKLKVIRTRILLGEDINQIEPHVSWGYKRIYINGSYVMPPEVLINLDYPLKKSILLADKKGGSQYLWIRGDLRTIIRGGD